MCKLAHRIMEEPMGDALAILNRAGSPKYFLGPRHRDALLFGDFLRGEHQKATRRLKAKLKTKKSTGFPLSQE